MKMKVVLGSLLACIVFLAVPQIVPAIQTANAACPAVNESVNSASQNATIPLAGTYTIWSRIWTPDTTNNSFLLKVDANCATVGDAVTIPPTTWTWINYQDANAGSRITQNLTAGSHTVTLMGKEANVKVDKILFVPDSCVPTGLGDNCNGSASVTPINVVPTFVCIGGQPCTSPLPSIPDGTTAPTNPATTNSPTTPPSTQPTIAPCTTDGTTSIQARKKHRKHRGGNGGSNSGAGFLERFIQWIMKFIEQILKLFGITLPTPTPNPTPGVPAPTGTEPQPTTANPNPTEPTAAPCPEPTSGQTPTSAPQPTTAPSGTVPTTSVTPGTNPSQSPTQTTNCAPNPHLCGFPDATNTGIPAGTVLKSVPGQVSNGPGWHYDTRGWITVDGSGAVLDGIQTADGIDVQAPNVTIKNCKINLNTSGNSVSWHSTPGILLRNGSSNVTIQNCEIYGTGKGKDRMEVGIKGQEKVTGIKIIGNNIYNTSTGVQTDEGLIQDNYIHDLGFADWGGSNGPDHLNGTTSNAVTGPLTIQHNTVFNSFGQTDAVSLFEDFSAQYDRTINNNLLAGGGYTIYGGANAGGQPTHNIKITNNRISKMYYPNGGSYGYLAAFDSNGSGNVWSGNVWDETGTTINP